MPRLRVLSILILAAAQALAADAILLWPHGAPGSEGKTAPEQVTASKSGERNIASVHQPSITPVLPAAADRQPGPAVLVIPGGGHSKLCVDHEGFFISEWLAKQGIAAFVLKHRLAREPGSTYTILDHALADTQAAMRLIRSRAGEWKIDPKRVGAMGFSAGGELVAQASMRPGDACPDYQILVYPGRSGDIQPAAGAPPAFLLCGENDRKDIAEGLAETYLRFKKAGVSAEFHVYAGVGHGFGYRPAMTGPVAAWPLRLAEWMQARGFVGTAVRE
jgi:acetyl esterase/lipase